MAVGDAAAVRVEVLGPLRLVVAGLAVEVRGTKRRVYEALAGYLEVIDYFARTGNWTHQWVTLRNLADLLHRLGDREPAALLLAAADRAPDAPPVERPPAADPPPTAGPAGSIPHRVALLEVARQAIQWNLR